MGDMNERFLDKCQSVVLVTGTNTSWSTNGGRIFQNLYSYVNNKVNFFSTEFEMSTKSKGEHEYKCVQLEQKRMGGNL